MSKTPKEDAFFADAPYPPDHPESLRRQLAAERDRADKIKALVDEQAEDEALWFIATTVPEAYLQQELRRLHAVIEEAMKDA